MGLAEQLADAFGLKVDSDTRKARLDFISKSLFDFTTNDVVKVKMLENFAKAMDKVDGEVANIARTSASILRDAPIATVTKSGAFDKGIEVGGETYYRVDAETFQKMVSTGTIASFRPVGAEAVQTMLKSLKDKQRNALGDI